MSVILGTAENPMTAGQAVEFVTSAFEIDRTPFLIGPPGVGKTETVHEVGRRLGMDVEVRLLAQFEPSDFVGLPHIYDDAQGRKRSKFAIPETFSFDKPVILFLDEFAQADIAVQRAASEIILNHTFGGIPLAKGTKVVAASNRKQDRAGVSEVLGHNKSRMITAHISVEAQGWCDWAAKNGIHSAVIGFIFTKGNQALLNVDHKAYSYPCPRTWVMVSDILVGAQNNKIHSAMVPTLVAGCVGSGIGSEFLSFFDSFESLPQLSDILGTPDKAKLPKKEPDQIQIAKMIINNLDSIKLQSSTGQAVEYMQRLNREAVSAAMKSVISEATKAGDGRRMTALSELSRLVDGN